MSKPQFPKSFPSFPYSTSLLLFHLKNLFILIFFVPNHYHCHVIIIHYIIKTSMERSNESDFEEDTLSDSSMERNVQSRKPHKGGKIISKEPISMSELLAFPLATTCFRYQSHFEFCKMVERIKYHQELARQFVINIDNNMVHLARVNFTLSPTIIVEATRIPDVGEKLNKRKNISKHHYEPYIKAKYHGKLSKVFPFKFLEDRYVPFMKLIIK